MPRRHGPPVVEVGTIKLGGGTMLGARLPGLRPLGAPERDPSVSQLALSAGSAASLRGQPRD